jgi:hypothetical protein
LLLSLLYLPETLNIKIAKKELPSIFSTAKQLAKDKKILGYCALIGSLNSIIMSFYTEAAFIFINLLKVPEKHYGLIGIVISAAFLVGSEISRKMTHNNKTPSNIILAGCLILNIGATLLITAGYSGVIDILLGNIAYIAIMIPVFIIFIGVSITLPSCLSMALVSYKHILGTAGSVFGFSYYIVISILTYLMAEIHNASVFPMINYFFILSLLNLIIYYSLIRPVRL